MRTLYWLFIVILTVAPAVAQDRQPAPWKGPGDVQQMVGELRKLMDEAERDRAAHPNFLRGLKTLASRYDWPWSKQLVRDNFEDGDYTRNPTWTVESGQFGIDWNAGLRSAITVAAVQPEPQPQQQTSPPSGDLGTQLLGTVLQQMMRPQESPRPQESTRSDTPAPSDRAEVSIAQAITPGFDIRMEFSSLERPGRLEFGPYLGDKGQEGYRLAYIPGDFPSLALLRNSRWGSAIIDAYSEPVNLEDGGTHYLQWLRLANGEMAVFLDGTEVIRIVDRAFQESFQGFRIANLGGEFSIREVQIFGTP